MIHYIVYLQAAQETVTNPELHEDNSPEKLYEHCESSDSVPEQEMKNANELRLDDCALVVPAFIII